MAQRNAGTQERRNSGTPPRVVVLGCGRLGSRIAAMLDGEGYAVTVIDTNGLAFHRLPDTFRGRTVLGTGIDEDVLRRAGIAEAHTFIAVTNEDNPNIMAAQVAREVFQVPEIVVRIYDVARAEVYRGLGLKTICPTTVIADMVRAEMGQ